MVDAKKHELPEQHGFVVQTSLDGQKWRAWRVLPSAWVLGMGCEHIGLRVASSLSRVEAGQRSGQGVLEHDDPRF